MARKIDHSVDTDHLADMNIVERSVIRCLSTTNVQAEASKSQASLCNAAEHTPAPAVQVFAVP